MRKMGVVEEVDTAFGLNFKKSRLGEKKVNRLVTSLPFYTM